MRLFCCECRKIWGNSIVQRAILLSFLLDICVIGILAFRDNQSFPISEYRAICEELESREPKSAQAYLGELADACKPETIGIYTERYRRLSALSDEVNKILSYESYIERITEAPEKYRQISLFHLNESSYDKAKIEKTADTYAGLQGIRLQVKNTRGTEMFLTSGTRLWCILAVMFVCSLAAFFWERSKGEEQLAYTMYSGRHMRGICKIAALFCTSFGVAALFFVTDYLFFGFVYGFENPGDMVMGVPGFISTPYAYTVTSYTGLLFLSAAAAAFLWTMVWGLTALRVDSVGLIILAATGLFGAAYMCSYGIRDVSFLRVFKYMNPVSLLLGNVLYQTICFINIAGRPVNVIPLVWGAYAVSAATLSTGIILHRSRVTEGGRRFLRIRRQHYPDSLFLHESYRLLFYCRGIIILVLTGVSALAFAHYDIEFLTPDEAYYKGYAEACSGYKTEQIKELIEQEGRRIETADNEIRKLEERLSEGEISAEAFSFMSAGPETVLNRKNAFTRLKTRVGQIEEIPGATVIYETGYLKLTEPWNARHIRSYIIILTAILAILVESEIRDRTNDMISLIESTACGRKRRQRTLLLLHVLYVILICAIVFGCEILAIRNSYLLKSAGSKAKSILEWKHTGELSVRTYLLFGYCFRAACIIAGLLVIKLFVSRKHRKGF
ncbi:MAG: hypothetical protein IJL03_00480 [Lachnospiraceae bacterium]|nr:hypothetical protein [Lachnospiraceae bacterium]